MSTATLDPGNLPLKMVRGLGFGPITITCKDGLGAAFNLTGYTVETLARPEPDSPTKITIPNSITLPATGGLVVLTELTDDQVVALLRNIPDGEWIYDTVLTNVSGNNLPETIRGVFTIETASGGTK